MTHDARLRRSLAYLLVDPVADRERLAALAEAVVAEERSRALIVAHGPPLADN